MDFRKLDRHQVAGLFAVIMSVAGLIGCFMLFFEVDDAQRQARSTSGKLDAIEEVVLEGEYSPITFEEAVQRLEKHLNQTQLQRGEVDWSDAVGKRVIWKGKVHRVGDPYGGDIFVGIHVYDKRPGIGMLGYAQLYFDKSRKENLLLVRRGDWVRFDCEFESNLHGTVPILNDCRLL